MLIVKVLGVLVLFYCGWGDVDKWNNGWCGNSGNLSCGDVERKERSKNWNRKKIEVKKKKDGRGEQKKEMIKKEKGNKKKQENWKKVFEKNEIDIEERKKKTIKKRKQKIYLKIFKLGKTSDGKCRNSSAKITLQCSLISLKDDMQKFGHYRKFE